MQILQILQVLGENVRETRKKGQWIAKCPVHNDKDFAMRIRENDQGGVSINCYACGANGLDVYRHLQLDLRELFGNSNAIAQDYVPAAVRDIYLEDQIVKAIYDADYNRGQTPSKEDARRMRLAVRRSKVLEKKYPPLKKTMH